MFIMFGYLCYAFGIADVALYVLDIADLTGVVWSPIVAFVVGSMLMKMGSGPKEEPA